MERVRRVQGRPVPAGVQGRDPCRSAGRSPALQCPWGLGRKPQQISVLRGLGRKPQHKTAPRGLGRKPQHKAALIFLLLSTLLCGHAAAAWQDAPPSTSQEEAWEVPPELRQLDPDAARAVEDNGADGLLNALRSILQNAASDLRSSLLSGARAAGILMAGVTLLGAVESLIPAEKEKLGHCTAAAGALWVTAVSAGDLTSLIGLGRETIGKLDILSKGLLPVAATATAASGGFTAASARQAATVFFSDLLLTAIDRALLPMTYLYIGVSAAGAVLEGDTMDRIGALLKKFTGWALGLLVTAFTIFLTFSGAAAGAADARAVKAAKSAISTAVPVVGGILSDAAETLLASAGVLRSIAGAFGAAALLGLCLAPFLHLGVQYLLYQCAALVSSAAGPDKLGRLISRLGDAFALVLAMTASSAAVLLISLVSSLTVVT